MNEPQALWSLCNSRDLSEGGLIKIMLLERDGMVFWQGAYKLHPFAPSLPLQTNN